MEYIWLIYPGVMQTDTSSMYVYFEPVRYYVINQF